jgi:hypothetical protein
MLHPPVSAYSRATCRGRSIPCRHWYRGAWSTTSSRATFICSLALIDNLTLYAHHGLRPSRDRRVLRTSRHDGLGRRLRRFGSGSMHFRGPPAAHLARSHSVSPVMSRGAITAPSCQGTQMYIASPDSAPPNGFAIHCQLECIDLQMLESWTMPPFGLTPSQCHTHQAPP